MRIALAFVFLALVGHTAAQRPQLIVRQDGHYSEPYDISLSPDEKQALSADGKRIVLWDLSSGKYVRHIEMDTSPVCLSFSQGGHQVLALLNNNSLQAWNLASGSKLWSVPIPDSRVLDAQVSPNRQYLAVCFEGLPVYCWDLSTGKQLWIKEVSNPAPGFLTFSADSKIVTVRAGDGTPLAAWQTASPISNSPLPGQTNNIGFPLSTIRRGKALRTEGSSLILFDFPNNTSFALPRLGETVAQTGMPVTDYVFSQDRSMVVVALGVPTSLWAITPGLPANRKGKGGLLIWDLKNDKLFRQMEGIAEIIQAVALTADGRQCLTVSSDQRVCLWDIYTGKERLRLQREPAMEHNFRITPDFKKLALTDYNGAYKYWEMDQRSDLVARAPNYDQSSFYSAADFDAFELGADGKQLLTASRNFSLKLWNNNPLQYTGILEDRHNCLWVATAMDISPDGKKALVGSSQEWRVMSMRRPTEIPRKDVQEYVTNNAQKDTIGVVWNQAVSSSPRPSGKRPVGTKTTYGDVRIEGDMVYVSGNYFNVSLWDLKKMHSLRIFKTGARDWHPISDLRFSPDGRLASATVLDDMMAWNIGTGDRVLNAQGSDHFHAMHLETSPYQAATIGPDGADLTVWNLTNGAIIKRITSPYRLLAAAFHPSGKRLCALSESGILTEWDVQSGQMKQQFSGVKPGQIVQYSPEGIFLLVRGNRNTEVWNMATGLRVLDLSSSSSSGLFSTEKFFEGHAGDQISLFKFTPDGSRAWAATYDGTLRGWDLKTSQELFTIYFPGEKEWVVTAPSGLFDASPGAMRMMYFVVGTEVVDLEQLKERYFEPGLLQKILGLSTEPMRSVTGFDSVALYPKVYLRLDTLKSNLHISLIPRNGGIGKVSVFINGKEIIEDANLPGNFDNTRDTELDINLEAYARYFLADSLNVLSVRAYNEAGWLKSGPHTMELPAVLRRSKGDGDNDAGQALMERAPTLHVLAVGTANYAGTELDLRYSGKDARDIVLAFGQIGKQLFRDSVYVTLLTTDTSKTAMHPTKENIQKAFESIKKRAKAEDILVVYFSGHGIAYGEADRALFYYLTQEIGSFDLSDAGVREKRTVSSNELTRWINDIPAMKQVLILDACNSAKILESLSVKSRSLGTSQIRALDRMKDRTGMFVLTGSAADKVSYEAGEFEQGLLTYSILQFVKTLGNQGDHPVDVMNLFQYACDKVPELARGIGGVQKPMPAAPLGGASFDIGIVNQNVNILLAEKKKVFIRSVFQDDDLGDVLNLTQETENYFQEIMARGDQAKLLYLDIGAYENGYSIRGRYRIEGETVKLSVNLFRNNKALSPSPLEVIGKKNAVQELIKATMSKISPLLKAN